MIERGGFSFVALLVINPMVILLYQNCSFSPVAQGDVVSRDLASQKRVISSVAQPQQVTIGNRYKMVKAGGEASCDSSRQNCPLSSQE